MIGGLLRTTSLAALLAVGGLVGGMSQANAADLGGDCCADLEERVAELEATTARKGNRKVSLTVSGQVNELVYWWDDGHESNVYVGTSGYSSSRFRFKGDAKINADWSAGYYMEVEVVSAQVHTLTATSDDGPASANAVKLRQSNWFLKSKTLGTITVGQQSHATDDIILYSLAGVGIASASNHNVAPGAGLLIRRSGTGTNTVASSALLQFLDSDRANLVRYDSPSIAGFTFSASWGEDDMWDVALRYAGEFAGIKVAGGIGYHEERDNQGDDGTANISLIAPGTTSAAGVDFDEVRGSISVLHEPSGLFVDFAGIWREFDVSYDKSDFKYWDVRAGIHQKFFALGKTTIFGEYAKAEGALEGSLTSASGLLSLGDNVARVNSDEITVYGIGLQQNIDAAAMQLYMGWRHFEADISTNNLANTANVARPTDGIDTVYTGARIEF